MRAWVIYHSITSLDDFLMWELDTLQYDTIPVCFPSKDPSQPNSLVSLKPNSIRHLIKLRKYIHQPNITCLLTIMNTSIPRITLPQAPHMVALLDVTIEWQYYIPIFI